MLGGAWSRGSAGGGSVPECWGPGHPSRKCWEPLGGASSSSASAEVQVCQDGPAWGSAVSGGVGGGGWHPPTEEWGGAGVQGVGQAVDRQAEGPCLAERPLPVVRAG